MDLLLALLGLLAVLHVAYATWTAKRLDRLHRRVDSARSALDAQLRQRAQVASAFAAQHRLPALAAAAAATAAVEGLGHDREMVENDLSRALQTVVELAEGAHVDVTIKTSFARRFHNDAVRDVLEVRTRRIVRWSRLAGHAPLPSYFEIVDTSVERRTIEV